MNKLKKGWKKDSGVGDLKRVAFLTRINLITRVS